MDNVVDELSAKAEIEKWLDHKKVRAKVREKNSDNIEQLVECIMDGFLTLDETTFELKQKLAHEIGEDKKISELVFKPRLKMFEIQQRTKGVKVSDTSEYVMAYVSALTGQPAAVLKQLDSSDYGIGQNLAVFFI